MPNSWLVEEFPETLGQDWRDIGSRVDVWKVRLDCPESEHSHYRELLSSDELLREERYRPLEAKRNFRVARGALRLILGGYLGVSPESIRFCYEAQGKPKLDGEFHNWRFNLSHSGDLCLIAVARGLELGVDIEMVRPRADVMALAKRFFSLAEQEELSQVPDSDQLGAFLRGWTRKEAFLKAVGTGLTLPLSSFDVTLAHAKSRRPQILEVRETQGGPWALVDLAVDPGYAGALVAACSEIEVRGWTWAISSA